MRLLTVAIGLVLVVGLAVWVWTNVFVPPPAAERRQGVGVVISGFSIDDLSGGGHRLRLTVTVSSARDLDECLGFVLDEPFANRRLATADGPCVRPRGPCPGDRGPCPDRTGPTGADACATSAPGRDPRIQLLITA